MAKLCPKYVLAWGGASIVLGCVGGLDDAPGIDPGAERGYVPAHQAEDIAPAPTLHRLNRIEYNHTVRDLTGTTLTPADNFPPDPTANGFDNMADQLGVTANQLSAYFSAAREVINDALDERPMLRVDTSAQALSKSGGYAVGILWALSGTTASTQFEVKQTGVHQVQFELGASVVGPAPAPTAELKLDDTVLESAPVKGSSAAPEVRSFEVELQPGMHTLSITPTNFVNMAAENTANNVFVKAIRVTSNTIVPGPGRSKIMICEPLDSPSCYRQIVEHFMERAWRRPPNQSSVDQLVELGNNFVAKGESLEDSLKLVLRGIMTSPRFFFRTRTEDDRNINGRLDPYVLASRLSYFLWSSMPDDALLAAAANGSLQSKEGLQRQVARMIADPKASALEQSFAEQWLSVREFERVMPDAERFPTFNPEVKTAMAEESLRFFDDYLDNNLPVRSMLEPDFAYRNDSLAAHYQEPVVGSEALKRVAVSSEARRGLMALGAWLVARSTTTHASPIRRGAWVSEHVLCQPVLPPPAGLEIPDLDLGAEEVTVREQLEQHRSDPRCASCHARLDIVGMGFQLFDAAGVRVADTSLDSLGELPDGATFRGAEQFAQIESSRARFASCITEKLMTYALGRGIDSKDLPDIERLADRVQTASLTLPELIAEIVTLPSFMAATPLEGQP